MVNNLKLVAFLSSVIFTCLIFTPTNAQVPKKKPPQNAASISGRITVGGKPEAGVVVELLKTYTNSSRRKSVVKVTTTKNGSYLITGIASGTYDVSPSAPMLAVPNEGRLNQSGKSITIEAGEVVRGVDFNLVRMGGVSGRVSDIDGQPVADQTVALTLTDEHGYMRGFSPPQLSSLKTDDRGGYHISGVPPGRYLISVGVPYGNGIASLGAGRGERNYYAQTFHPDATQASKATAIEIKTGSETTDVDITVGRPLKTYEIAGQVADMETGAPFPNVSLGAVITQSEHGRYETNISGAWRSDAGGEFRIKGALPGHYVVYPKNDESSNSYGDAVKFDIKDEDVTGLKVTMHHASSLSGIVTIEGIAENAISYELSKLRLFAEPLSAEPQTSGITGSGIEADGRFRITGIRPGKVTLSLDSHLPGAPQGLYVLRVERNGVELVGGIEVHPSEEASGLRLVLGSGNSVVRGSVKIEGGPLEGVQLYVNYRPLSGDPNRYYHADLDARGHFVIEKLMAGEYELMIGPMSVYVTSGAAGRTMSRMPTLKQSVSVGPGAKSEVTLVLTLKPE